MKKTSFILGMAVVAAFALSSCKSAESKYRKAYDEAAAARERELQQATQPVSTTPVINPVQANNSYNDDSSSSSSYQSAQVENVSYRTENVNVLDGGTIKSYSVVVGSFGKLENAQIRCQEVAGLGYTALIAQNPTTGMYRVIASSFDDKGSAAQSRDQLRSRYSDAWILYRGY